ncbi:MAG: 6-carboxytetrahydropterin synthase QueD [Dissulfurispiraceae bacterium]|nr:6-carboxytetrahydropterin synthase QueD [Dissulfurispiraceae bacterium]
MFELTIETDFASAHQLRGYKGKCENMHGHNWKVQVAVTANKLNDIDIAIDFGDLRAITNDIIAPLDHTCLNTIFPFTEINPSSENISKWIYESLKKRLPEGIDVTSVTVWESDTASATYYED